MKNKTKADVYIDFINYLGEVTESVWVASFCSVERAKEYLTICNDDEYMRHRIEERG